MRYSKVLCVASAVLVFAGMRTARAATELMYGFNDSGLNGFSISYDGSDNQDATISESTATGVTEGTGALDLHSGTSAGYTQTDLRTSTIPADLVSSQTSSLSLTAETYYADANYITVAPVLYLDGSFSNVAAGDPAGVFQKLLAASQTLQPAAAIPGSIPPNTLTFNLLFKDPYATAHSASVANGTAATVADGNSTTQTYTAGQILTAFLAANPDATASIDGFALETTTSGTAAGVDVYLDDVTIPAVPEPASLGIIAAAGLMISRRRRAH